MTEPPSVMYEKSHTVLWAETETVIVLRNFSNGIALELETERRQIWELCDGVHSEFAIAHEMQMTRPERHVGELSKIVRTTVELLASYGFVVPGPGALNGGDSS